MSEVGSVAVEECTDAVHWEYHISLAMGQVSNKETEEAKATAEDSEDDVSLGLIVKKM